jgi:hypothetical protein
VTNQRESTDLNRNNLLVIRFEGKQMAQPLTVRLIPADFLTSSQYIFGQLKTTQSGVLGMLSDTTTSYVEVNEASMASIHKPDKVTNYAPLIWLVKNQIVAVCLSKKNYAGSQAAMHSGYKRVFEYPVQVTTPFYDITGTLEWSGRFEFSALMSDGTNAFLMLNEAVLTAPLFPALHIESSTILLNRNFLDTLTPMKKSPQ